MNRVLGLITLFVGLFFLYFLQQSWEIGDKPVPALGNLLNPFSGIWQNAEPENGFDDMELISDSVSGTISIVFDERMVPHIYAPTIEDALFAQGYVEAYHRLFQMDLSTRAPAGEVSEIIGPKALEYDKKQCRLGLKYGAENAVRGWHKHPEELKLLKSYVNGVNHYINSLNKEDYPMEFKLLNYSPRKWTMERSALLLKAMSQTLAGYEEDIEYSNAAKYFSEEQFNTLYPEEYKRDVPVILEQYINKTSASNVRPADIPFLASIDRPRSPEGVGSNNWAVNGSKSKTGKPILANDPHLALSYPSVWYEIAITTPEFSAHGVTLLGMPGIMIGFNENIAWGETNVGHDVMDYHSLKWLDSNQTVYELDGRAVNVTYRVEQIAVKGNETITDSVRYTHWGPIVDDSINLALRWLAHDEAPGLEFLTFVNGMRSKNYDEYLAATSGFYCPAQNFIYADNTNEIGLRINGTLPIKKKGQGRLVSEGSKTTDGWLGFIARSKNPQERNPKRNFVASSNQRSATAQYPYYYNGNFESYRNRVVNDYLTGKDSFSLEEMKRLQLSNFSIEAKEVLPLLLAHLDSVNLARREAKSLANDWNFYFDAESLNATFYEIWYSEFKNLLWDEVNTATVTLPKPKTRNALRLLEEEPQSVFFDIVSTPTKEAAKDIVNQAFVKATEHIKSRKKWAEYKQANIPHLLRIPALSEEYIEVGGHKYAVNAMQQNFGPSWRMLVELGDKPIAYGIFPGGQSGNPASNFYRNNTDKWAKGEYHKITLANTPAEVEIPVFTITITNED